MHFVGIKVVRLDLEVTFKIGLGLTEACPQAIWSPYTASVGSLTDAQGSELYLEVDDEDPMDFDSRSTSSSV